MTPLELDIDLTSIFFDFCFIVFSCQSFMNVIWLLTQNYEYKFFLNVPIFFSTETLYSSSFFLQKGVFIHISRIMWWRGQDLSEKYTGSDKPVLVRGTLRLKRLGRCELVAATRECSYYRESRFNIKHLTNFKFILAL